MSLHEWWWLPRWSFNGQSWYLFIIRVPDNWRGVLHMSSLKRKEKMSIGIRGGWLDHRLGLPLLIPSIRPLVCWSSGVMQYVGRRSHMKLHEVRLRGLLHAWSCACFDSRDTKVKTRTSTGEFKSLLNYVARSICDTLSYSPTFYLGLGLFTMWTGLRAYLLWLRFIYRG